MADYYSLLSRAVSNLRKKSPAAARRAIYARARKALIGQLRSLKPPLPESDIAREENALDVAVKRLAPAAAPARAACPPPPPVSPTERSHSRAQRSGRGAVGFGSRRHSARFGGGSRRCGTRF